MMVALEMCDNKIRKQSNSGSAFLGNFIIKACVMI